MAFIDWTGNLVDAPYEVIETAIQKVLNGAPIPHMSPADAVSQVFIDENPEYRSEYQALCTWYVTEFAEVDQLNLNEYGFSTWQSSHPLINALNLVYNKFHWHHMKPIVKRIERNVRIQELDSGRHFSQKDRLELIASKAYEERDGDRRFELDVWSNASINAAYRRLRESGSEVAATLNRPQPSGSLIDRFADYNRRNPLTVGLIGATIYHKLKDAFSGK